MTRIRVWFVFSALILIFASAVLAQLPVGTILGVVRDSSGGVVPDANLTARNLDTGQTRTVTTGEDGSYRFSALAAGRYEVRTEKSGFQTDVRTGVTLSVAQEAVLNVDLQVGGVEQQVLVSGEAPQVNTTSGSLGGLMDAQRIDELPLNGRNYIDLTLLTPGISQHRNLGANPGNSGGLWYSSNGAPVRSNNYLLDGAYTGTLSAANSSSVAGATLGLDGIREYRVITNAFSAEYGMTMGSQITIVSRGGTNSWHGTLFEYIRNGAMDARNFFDPQPSQLGRRIPQFQRNNFGGSIGGPMQRDKTFFHFVYEGLRQNLGLRNVSTVLGAGCHGAAGDVITNVTCPQLGTTVPSVTIAAVIKPFLDLYPISNLPNNQFTYPFTAPMRDNYAQLRVDHTFSANDAMFARYTFDDAFVTTSIIPNSYPGFTVDRWSRAQFATLSETHIFSPSLVSTTRFSFGRTNPRTISDSPYTGPQYSFVPANSNQMGNIAIGGGVSTFGTYPVAPVYLLQNLFTWSDDVFYTRGKHAFKFGTLINRYQQLDDTARGFRGTITFSNVAGFLQGLPQNYTATTPAANMPGGVRIDARNYRSTTMGFYAQDDYRMFSRLTLNLGLRYEFSTQFHERDGYQASIRNLLTDSAPTVGVPFKNPSLGNVSPRVGFGWDVMGNGKTAVRGGFALLYDLNPYGGAMNIIQPSAKPFSSVSTVVNSTTSPSVVTIPLTFAVGNIGNTMSLYDYGLKQQHLMSYNFTVEQQLPFAVALSVAYAGSRGINILGVRDGNPRIPRGVPDSAGACTGLLATGATPNLTSMVDGVATACWAPTPTGGANPNPFLNPSIPASISLITGAANSFYNALQVVLSKRTSSGLQFQSSYTFSKLIDDPQAEATNELASSPVQPTDAFNRSTDRGLSGYDITHNWRFSVTYQLPQMASTGSFLAKLVNGWQTSSIVSVQTGYPFTVNVTPNRSRSGAFQSLANLDRPSLVPGRSLESITSGVSTADGSVACPTAGKPLGTPTLWFDPCAFRLATPGFLGNSGRNTFRGPGLSNVDFSIVKNTPVSALGEAGRVEFRAELFNLFNHANFSMPNRSVNPGASTNAGQIQTTGSATARQIQLALKVVF